MEIKTKVFPNQYKTPEEKDKKKPDYTGNVKDTNLQVAVWKNEDGSLFIQVKEKTQ